MRASVDVSSRRLAGRYATSGSKWRRKDVEQANSSSGFVFPTSLRNTDAGGTASPSRSLQWWTATTTVSNGASTSWMPRAENATFLAETQVSRFWCSYPRGGSRLGSRTLEEKRSTRRSGTIPACHGQESAGRTSTVLPPCAGAGGSGNRLLPRWSPPAQSSGDGPARCQEAEPDPGVIQACTAAARGRWRTR